MSEQENKTQGMDLSNLGTDKAEEGAWLQLEHPTTGEPLVNDNGDPMEILVGGTYAKEYERASENFADKFMEKRQKKGDVSYREIKSANREIILSAVYDWRGIQEDGELVDFDKNKARNLFKKYPWIQQQVKDFQEDLENFLGN